MTNSRLVSWLGFFAIAITNAAILTHIAQWHGNFGPAAAPFVQLSSLLQFLLPIGGYFYFRAVYATSTPSTSVPHVQVLVGVGASVIVGLALLSAIGLNAKTQPHPVAEFMWEILCSLLFVPFLGALIAANSRRAPRSWYGASAYFVIIASLGSVIFVTVFPETSLAEYSFFWVLWLFICVLGFYFSSLSQVSLALWVGALVAMLVFCIALSGTIFFVGLFYGGGAPLILFGLFACVLGVLARRRAQNAVA